jgi:NAD(P)-dependent dehydrogenase (short-subunit alcohol dehydrogenase family)
MTSEAFSLADKIAIVVGGGGGIGSSIPRRFVEADARVACVDLAAPRIRTACSPTLKHEPLY